MCESLWECIKCPGKVVCCCCKCACNMLLGFLCSGVVILIVIGLIVYFTVFYHKDGGKSSGNDGIKAMRQIVETAPQNFRSLFKNMQ